MTDRLGRLLVRLAAGTLPGDVAPWGDAMEAEYDAICEEGGALRYAAGCCVASARTAVGRPAGRFALARNAAALLVLPFALLPAGCAVQGFRLVLAGHDAWSTAMMRGGPESRAAARSYVEAAPALTFVLVLLAIAHLLAAQHLADWRIRRLVRALAAAALFACSFGALIFSATGIWAGLQWQFVGLGVEVPLLLWLLGWERRMQSSSLIG